MEKLISPFFTIVFILTTAAVAHAQVAEITDIFVRDSIRGEKVTGWVFAPDEPLTVTVLRKQSIDEGKRIRVIAWIKASDISRKNFVEGRLKLIYNADLTLKSVYNDGLVFSGENVERAERQAAERKAAAERAEAELRVAADRARANYVACPAFSREIKLNGGEQWAYAIYAPYPGHCSGTFSAYNDNDDASELIYDAVLGRYIRRKPLGDVEILIYDEVNYVLRSQNRSNVALFSSGRETTGTFDVMLPAGRFFIVVSNQHSYLARKSVTLSLGGTSTQ